MRKSRSSVNNPLIDILTSQACVILDGAMGTQLEQRGVDLNSSKLWSSQLLIDNPAILKEIHYDYIMAGADVITTATYQASMAGFESAGKSDSEAGELIRLAVKLAAEARDAAWQQLQAQGKAGNRRRPLVGFSAGSYGACLCDGSEFTGTYAETMSEQELADWHLQRLLPAMQDPQVWSLVDLLCIETVPCLKEVRALCQLLVSHPQLAHAHVWISCSCRDAAHTCHGESFAELVVPLVWGCDQVVALGVNCTAPLHVPQLLAGAQAALMALSAAQAQPTSAADAPADELGDQGQAAQQPEVPADATIPAPLPSSAACGADAPVVPLAASQQQLPVRRRAPAPLLLCYPNSGEQWDGEGRCWAGDPWGLAHPEGFARAARSWVAAGAKAVGGCCRTGPEHIAALRASLLTSPAPEAHD